MDLTKTAERIKKRRNELGKKSQDALAEKIGVDRKTVQLWENGSIPKLDKIIKLADALECDPEYLLGCVEHPTVTTSWISEQLPLSEKAINHLIDLKNYQEAFGGAQYSFILDAEAGMIDKLICSLCEGIEDATNNISWNAEELMDLLIVADREDERNENINHRMMIRQSFCMAVGGVAFDYVSNFADKNMASLMMSYEKSQMVEDELFIAKVDRRKEELGITQDEYVQRVFGYLNRGYVYIKAVAAALETDPEYLKNHTIQDVIDFSDDPKRKTAAISALLKERPELYKQLSLVKETDYEQLMAGLNERGEEDGNI